MVDPLTTAAISWGFTAAGWLISPVLTRFLNKCFDALGMDPPPKFQSKKQILLAKLDKLQTILLPQLIILTDAAQKSSHRPILENWIQKLKSAFYESEHVLGLVEYEHLEKKVNSLFPSTSKFNFKNLKATLPKFSSEKKKLIASLENLEKVITEGMEFVSLLNLPSSGVNNSTWRPNEQDTQTISTPDSTVIGRDQDRDYIVKLLREDLPESSNNESCYSVIGIWGMGGSGKTTLAQYVCEFERTKIEENNEKYFDCVIWAHVSQQFSVHVIWKNIWESAFKEPCPTFSSLEGLQSELEKKLRGQRVFLVLDDVWCDKGVSVQQVGKLFSPLKDCKRGSKVLVTTRIDEAAKVLGAMNPIPLRELDEDQFFSLFMSNAVGNAQISDKQMNDKLNRIGKEIAIKLRRSPLAAKTVAAQLHRSLNAEFWSSMLTKCLLSDTMGALLLSYQNLPSALQRCFAFCSLFPKGHLFLPDDLVNLWVVEGFIETDDSNEHARDTATRYILELVSCSFFQVDKRYGNRYFMHDLMHDLAEHVQSECFKIVSGEEKEIPTQTRHLYVVGDMLVEYMEKICKLKDLCTIVVSLSMSDLWKEVDLDALFTNLKKLRIVDLKIIESLPKSVIHLKNLCYLKIVQAYSISDSVVESLNRLYQLRVLFISKNFPSLLEIPDVGRLILLQDLGGRFYVRKKRGFELHQLEHLTDLCGSLSILGLHEVERKGEAQQVKLSEKKSLRELRFNWDESKDASRDGDVEIFDGLCPPPKIKELFIEGYSGKRFPNWILENNDNISHLESLRLANCNFLEALSGVDKLSNLLSLTISHLPGLKSWVPLPLNLTRLDISGFLSLAFALKDDLETIKSVSSSNNHECDYDCTSDGCQLERVQEIIKQLDGGKDEQALSTIANDFKGCLDKTAVGEFKGIYGDLYLPLALEDLSIKSCIITDRVLAGSLQGLNSLTHLKLKNIITITCITEEVLCSLSSLTDLDIRKCLLLTSIGGWDTHGTLEKLNIYNCPNLTLKASLVANSCNTVEQASSSYKRKTATSSILKIICLQMCSPLDDCFQNLVSTEKLAVWDCSTIVNPHVGNLRSLIKLGFWNCSNLISLRGLSELNHLERLEITECQKVNFNSDADKLPRLRDLEISKLSLVEQVIIRDGLSSLVSLTLYKAEEEYFSQQECEVLCFLSSLETIKFSFCEIRMLPSLLGLHTLRSVEIKDCKNLTSLSEVPPSVQRISIYRCNEDFTKSCKDPENPNWQKISHIPKKNI